MPWTIWTTSPPETLEAAKRQMRAELGGPLPAWFPCPCCGFLTLTERPPGTFDICPVCFWEDDNVQYNDPDYAGGANVVSPNQARKNFAEFGATERRVLEYVRRPRPSEQPG